jgi:hypothetical protein
MIALQNDNLIIRSRPGKPVFFTPDPRKTIPGVAALQEIWRPVEAGRDRGVRISSRAQAPSALG